MVKINYISTCTQVFRCNFWMCFFDSKSPKRTSVWSNRSFIKKFWLGKLSKKIRQDLKLKYPDFYTTVKYVDKKGKKRYHGSRQLKSTQTRSCIYMHIFSRTPWRKETIFHDGCFNDLVCGQPSPQACMHIFVLTHVHLGRIRKSLR